MNWLRKGLQKTRNQVSGGFKKLFGGKNKIAEEDLDSVEEILLRADLGPSTVLPLIDRLRVESPEGIELENLKNYLEKELHSLFQPRREELKENGTGPTVIFLVGVNGTGKTTTLAKITRYLQGKGKNVLIASCDTFRAAATDQLKIWADRLGVEVIGQGMGADPAAIAYDALKAAQSRKIDYLLCDTAGRLHNKSHLMEELKKMARVISKECPGAPHEILLVLDATTGQNGFTQAKEFQKELNLSGLVVSKLDGTAKGGVVVSIEKELKIPIKFIGVGESVEDFAPFSPQDFVRELLHS